MPVQEAVHQPPVLLVVVSEPCGGPAASAAEQRGAVPVVVGRGQDCNTGLRLRVGHGHEPWPGGRRARPGTGYMSEGHGWFSHPRTFFQKMGQDLGLVTLILLQLYV